MGLFAAKRCGFRNFAVVLKRENRTPTEQSVSVDTHARSPRRPPQRSTFIAVNKGFKFRRQRNFYFLFFRSMRGMSTRGIMNLLSFWRYPDLVLQIRTFPRPSQDKNGDTGTITLIEF
jgi:hypothetical protein